MAKVEIEDRAFNEPALRIASSKHKVPVAYIIGCIAIVWRASQQVGAVEATGEEIMAWLDTDRFIKPERAIQWLISADLIRSVEKLENSYDIFSEKFQKNSFKISGNAVAVIKAKKRIENARVAVSSRYNKEPSYDSYTDSRKKTYDSYTTRIPNNKTVIQEDNKTIKQEKNSIRQPDEKISSVVELWNSNKSAALSAVKLNSLKNGTPRHRNVKARLQEEPDLGYWENVFKKVAASNFCNGSGSTKWVANFDWVFKPGNHFKISEGNYDDNKDKNELDAWFQMMREQEAKEKMEQKN
jgi:hypothetical protein